MITTEVINTLKHYPEAKVIITAGICDCSFRFKVGEKFRFTFSHSNQLAAHLIELFGERHKKIATAYPNARISYDEMIV